MDRWNAAEVAQHDLAWPIRPYATRFAAYGDWPTLEDLNRSLADAIGGHVFVPSGPRRRHRRRAPVASGDLYDGRIVLRREVPSRARCWHDFYNALTWAAWPQAKRRLHERQYETIAERVGTPTLRLPARRTQEQDQLAMLDEGGIVVLVGPEEAPALGAALARGDEGSLRCALREGRAHVLVFGHALFDHLRGSARSVFVRPEVVVAPAGVPGQADRHACLAVADAALSRALAERRAPARGPVVACDIGVLAAPEEA